MPKFVKNTAETIKKTTHPISSRQGAIIYIVILNMEKEVNLLRGCSIQTLDGERKCNPSSCNKLNVYNFLIDLPLNESTPDIVEVRFKNTRKAFFHNVNGLRLKEGDMVAVEASPGHDIGTVSLTGELVREQMRVKRVRHTEELKKVYRKVKDMDIEKYEKAIAREQEVMLRSRQIAKRLELDMKIGDVEFQGDGSKAIFYYIADSRVDFRQLIRSLADEFKIRIEMRQIGARQEAGRIGGIGSCGRELCCSSWMTTFISVSTDTARDQELSLNPQKLAGQCGKLKCCLNFEQDTYLDAKKDFPGRLPLQTAEGTAYYFKTDVHKQTIWYSYDEHYPKNVTGISVDRVHEIISMNKSGNVPEKLMGISDFEEIVELSYTHDLDDSITRFDNKNKNKKKKRNNKSKIVSNSTETEKSDVQNKEASVNKKPELTTPNPNQQKQNPPKNIKKKPIIPKNESKPENKSENKPENFPEKQAVKQPEKQIAKQPENQQENQNTTGIKKLVKKSERPPQNPNDDTPPKTE